jgi:hypothetical protein
MAAACHEPEWWVWEDGELPERVGTYFTRHRLCE